LEHQKVSFVSERTFHLAYLFEPLTLRGVTLPNRVAVSPMCEYSCVDGLANEWHFVHLGSRAVGGAGLVLTEAAAISPVGRISPDDLGFWSDAQIEPLARITRFIRSQGSVAGIQLAHAGRKASTPAPWKGNGRVEFADGGWQPIAPSAIAFSPDYHAPLAMTKDDIRQTIADFAAAAARAQDAGFEVIELHAAHGYLGHQFLSPLSNQRSDEYGGSFANRVRFVLEMVAAVREKWPGQRPLFVRISATDWVEGGWNLDESVELAKLLKSAGVDLIDCSSGGLVPNAVIPAGPGYQVPFAERIRREAGIATGAVGMILAPAQAECILRTGQADMVLLARELLRDPYWPLHAAEALHHKAEWPAQYLRAAPSGSLERKGQGV
jgi:2,4-dienoyl-CoA reductase-like NADH-dependent reductase (Old Yellow Enzyme family)